MTLPVKLSPIEHGFLRDLSASGSGWGAELREELEARGLPHRRVEEWKWSDLKTALSRVESGQVPLTVSASREPDERRAPGDDDVMAGVMPRLAAALGGDASLYRLERQDDVLSLDIEANAGTGHTLIVVDVAPGISARLDERYAVTDPSLANIAILVRLGSGARLERTIEQAGSDDGVLVVTSRIELGIEAGFKQTTLGFGARLARLETHVIHPGEGAKVSLAGSYLLSGKRHLDQTTLVHHTGPNGETRELFKGAAGERARGVFQGKIAVDRAAQKTDAEMQHRGMLLSDGAEIDAKPELEIYADDVVCAHGNALGAIDDDALFYMRQRGMSETEARALLTESFLAEPLDAITDEVRRDDLLAKLRTALEALT
ncbi:SufB/SufD family protein [Marinicauda sp. Alg238-R41]|uniref:SufB/SufD family protein n=1 Tax=Marinicauda sp. Alg238-R41 TaxID=2993447 RepID=UPI0022E1DBCB|nr:SufD family Fe-S cluster assembly protein [Marinicauda sp. Alg238-R41]